MTTEDFAQNGGAALWCAIAGGLGIGSAVVWLLGVLL